MTTNINESFTVTVSDGSLSDSKILAIHISQQGITESNGAEKLIGTASNNKFDGLAGDDVIKGYGGSDTLKGGVGKDSLTGGLGADQFIYDADAESGNATSTRDVVVDFSHSQGDKINLSAIDANILSVNEDAFTAPTVGDSFSGQFSKPGQLYFDQTTHILYGNNDADNAVDFSILLLGVNNLVASDFIL